MVGTSINLTLRVSFFMRILQKRFIWSNLLCDMEIGRVCRLRKSLYGLKQSPHAWFGKFSEMIEKFGMQKSKSDHSVFYRNSQAGIILLVVYVGDIIITGNDMAGISSLKSFFHAWVLKL